jgi:hypothetical protein
MELDWSCTDIFNYEATKVLAGSVVFQRATHEPAGKTKKPTS